MPWLPQLRDGILEANLVMVLLLFITAQPHLSQCLAVTWCGLLSCWFSLQYKRWPGWKPKKPPTGSFLEFTGLPDNKVVIDINN